LSILHKLCANIGMPNSRAKGLNC